MQKPLKLSYANGEKELVTADHILIATGGHVRVVRQFEEQNMVLILMVFLR